MMTTTIIAVLGINGRASHAAAKAFVKAGYQVLGLGRSNRNPVAGVDFVEIDVDDPEALGRVLAPVDIVFNGLNLPYDKWDNGRAEAQHRKVLDAIRGQGKTLLLPGNIYNFGEKQHVITPDTAQHPARDKGDIRVRIERMYEQAARAGALDVIIMRAGDFYGPGERGSYFDLALMSKAEKGQICYPGRLDVPHSWAYLPDLGEAWVKVLAHRDMYGPFETFCFSGHFVTGRRFVDAVADALPNGGKAAAWYPWWLMRMIGVFVPLLREVSKMSYLWCEPHRLEDARLAELLGPDFGTSPEQAIAETVRIYRLDAQSNLAIQNSVHA